MTLRINPDNPSFDPVNTRGLVPAAPDGFVALGVSGADAATFLQGQLTINVPDLRSGQGTLGALCTVQGRVSATFYLLRFDDHFKLVLPATLFDATVAQLKRYVMRSKVQFDSRDDSVQIVAYTTDDKTLSPGECSASDSGFVYRPNWSLDDNRYWVLATHAPTSNSQPVISLSWPQAQVLWGIASLNESTTNSHLPQMLNLDALEAVSFNKGCYTGQEIIARTHFRGAVKRRLFRYLLTEDVPLSYDTKIEDADGKVAGAVVEFARDDDQQTGILAVMKLSAVNGELTLQGVKLQPWPLPYPVSLPD